MNAEYDLNAAQAVLEADRQARAEQARAAIEAVLQKFACSITGQVVVSDDGRLVAVVKVVAR